MNKKVIIISATVAVMLVLLIIVWVGGDSAPQEETPNEIDTDVGKEKESKKEKDVENDEDEEATENVSLIEDTDALLLKKQIESGISYDTGSYRLREIKKGNYLLLNPETKDKKVHAKLQVFNEKGDVVSYYETPSFTYIYVPISDKIELTGYLIPTSELKNFINVTGLGIYKILHGIPKEENYHKSGTYIVGEDIKENTIYLSIDDPTRLSRYMVYKFNDKNEVVVIREGIVEKDNIEFDLLEKTYLKLDNVTFTTEKPIVEEADDKENEKDIADENEENKVVDTKPKEK